MNWHKYNTAGLFILAAAIFTTLQIMASDSDQTQFLEFMARMSLFAGLLKAFLIREDHEYSEQIGRVADNQDTFKKNQEFFKTELAEQREMIEEILAKVNESKTP